MIEPAKSEKPIENIGEAAASMARAWGAMAAVASDIAAYRRTIFLAYVAEGFSEAQALELVKQI